MRHPLLVPVVLSLLGLAGCTEQPPATKSGSLKSESGKSESGKSESAKSESAKSEGAVDLSQRFPDGPPRLTYELPGYSEEEGSALGAMRGISVAQALFLEGDRDRDGVQDYGSLEELIAADLLDGGLASGKHGYLFEVQASPSVQYVWYAVARPDEGGRSFYTDQDGLLWETDDPSILSQIDPNTCAFPGVRRDMTEEERKQRLQELGLGLAGQ